MLLTNELQEKLKKLCDGKTKIVIKGFNELGDPFETKGRISKCYDVKAAVYKAAVYDGSLFLEFGKEKSASDTPYTKWVAQYYTEISNFEVLEATRLIITSITLDSGEVLLENADAEKYYAIAKEMGESFESIFRKNGNLIQNFDPVSKELFNYIGKPIVIDGNDCILTEAPRMKGGITASWAEIVNGDSWNVCPIGSNSGLIAVNLDTDEEEFVCANKDGWLQTYERLTGKKLKQKEKNKQVNEANQPGNE